MTIFERVKNIADSRKISLQKLAEKSGMGTNSIYGWKTKTPSVDKISAVADVLNVSTDYLLGRTDDPNKYLSETERMTSNIDLKEAKNNGAILSWGGVDIDDDDMEIIKRILEGK